jgi:hypothetical protein
MSESSAKLGPKLDRNAQQRIGKGLKQMYGNLAAAPIPDRLLGLLAQLDDKSSAKGLA